MLTTSAVDFRKHLEDLVNGNGGDYRGNLTKDVTHLIAKEPTGAKYKYAMEWNVKIVAVEWFFQSLERGMILDEALYSPLLPAPQRGLNAWKKKAVSMSMLGKRPHEDSDASIGSRKLRRTVSARLSSQTLGMWTDIVGGEARSDQAPIDAWAERTDRDDLQPQKLVTGSFDVATQLVNPKTRPNNVDSENSGHDRCAVARKRGIFSDIKILIHGFNDTRVIYILCSSLGSNSLFLRLLSYTTIFCRMMHKSFVGLKI